MSTTCEAGSVLADRIEARLTDLGYATPKLGNLRRLSGGASRETWSFDVNLADGRCTRMILRRDPLGEPRPEVMRWEATALAAGVRHGVPAPALLDHGADSAVVGSPYLLMEHVAGESIGRRILRDGAYAGAREHLAADLGRAAAIIHAVPVDELGDIPQADGVDLMRQRYLAAGVPRPVFELAFRWLEDRRPDPVPARLVHGDFRLGNVIVGPEGLAAVLDWELVHRGDPLEDLGYLCIRAWRFGGPQPVAGVGTFGQLFDAYAETSGSYPDTDRVRWWQVAGTLAWGVGAIVQANRHFTGSTRSVELAAVGRRVAEQEHDLLRMMEEA